MTELRLQVFLARAGLASRRGAEELIRQGRVTVNGEVVTRQGSRVEPERDHVKVDGRRVGGFEPHRYLALNVPRGVISTVSDPEGRTTVLDLVPRARERLHPVGRLDVQSEGLLLLTNDGPLTEALLHPRSHLPRTYHVKIRGHLDDEERRRLARGVVLDGRRTGAIRARTLRRRENASWLEVVVEEGRNHLVRRALEAVGHFVVRLRRVSMGPVQLGGLDPGAHRELSPSEVTALRRAVRRAGRGRASGGPEEPAAGGARRRQARRRGAGESRSRRPKS